MMLHHEAGRLRLSAANGPQLNRAAPDEVLQAAIIRDRGLVERAQQIATRTHAAARAQRWAPVNRLDAEWREFVNRTTEARAKATGTRTAADWQANIAQLRIAMEATEHFDRFAEHWSKLSEAQHAEEYQRDKATAWNARHLQVVEHQVRSNPPLPSGPVIIRTMANRGITLSIGHNDSILAHPPAILTPADREMIRARKDVVLAALRESEIVA